MHEQNTTVLIVESESFRMPRAGRTQPQEPKSSQRRKSVVPVGGRRNHEPLTVSLAEGILDENVEVGKSERSARVSRPITIP